MQRHEHDEVSRQLHELREYFYRYGPKLGDHYRGIGLGRKITITSDSVGVRLPLLVGDIERSNPERAYEAGSWVVSVNVIPTYAGEGLRCNPLILHVALADGSRTTTIEVDAGRSCTFQLPAGSTQVDAQLLEPPDGGLVPLTQDVQITMHRGFSTAQPTRSFWLAPGDEIVVAVPHAAKTFQVYGACMISSSALYEFTADNLLVQPVTKYSGTEVDAATRAGIGVRVPECLGYLDAASDGTGEDPSLGLLQFTLGL